MAYLISKDEATGKAVQRILLELNAETLGLLHSWRDDPALHIHRARQACKKLRALLRLIRPAAGYVYAVENRFYRNIQRSLAHARDAQAMVEALELLESQLSDPLPLQSLRMLKTALSRRAVEQTRAAEAHLGARIDEATAELESAADRLTRLPLSSLRRRDLRQGAEATLARCARGFHRLPEGAPGEEFHEWRKQVKYTLYQARLMQELLPEQSAALRKPLKDLADILGHSQDLKVLEDFLRRQPDALGVDTHLRRLFVLITAAQGELRGRAGLLGAELFGREPDGEVVPSGH
ncbi:MAG: CHAD domain-containing protein [Chromatiales bacterium]|nr:CHAD domain-containing protein [Chromatiales bacterium]